MRTVRLLAAALLLGASTARAAESLTPEQAAKHIGEPAKVCGVVASAKYATRTKGQPTFLNLGKAYPNQVFTALVWGSARGSFPYAPESLLGESICVEGMIVSYRSKPEIVVSRPSQIERGQR
jgi:hypothetical protein